MFTTLCTLRVPPPAGIQFDISGRGAAASFSISPGFPNTDCSDAGNAKLAASISTNKVREGPVICTECLVLY